MGLFDKLLGRVSRSRAEAAALPQKMESPVLRIANIQGMGQREEQEDSFALTNAADEVAMSQQGLFAIVADGMGGMADGRLASEAAVEGFVTLFHTLDPEGDIPRQLRAGATIINDQIFSRFSGQSGTTVVAVRIVDAALDWISIGDSAIYLGRNGGVFQLNREHEFVNDLYLQELRMETIDRERAERDPDCKRLTSFVGIDRLVEIDCNHMPLYLLPGDTLLLCSDGMSDILSSPELLEAMSLPVEEGCALLETFLKEKAVPEQDNYTGILIAYR